MCQRVRSEGFVLQRGLDGHAGQRSIICLAEPVLLTYPQMPIVDGLTSTKMIRSYEKTHPSDSLLERTALTGRVPIFAVSASLVETDRQSYIDAGFDGWVLKPVDFKRLVVLLAGILGEETRMSCLYKPGGWEKGGWFTGLQPDAFASSTQPLRQASVSSVMAKSHRGPEDPDAVHAPSTPADPGGPLQAEGT